MAPSGGAVRLSSGMQLAEKVAHGTRDAGVGLHSGCLSGGQPFGCAMDRGPRSCENAKRMQLTLFI
jgi:hypothetical protein